MALEKTDIVTPKGHSVAATLFESNPHSGRVLIVASAIGVKQSFYQSFAEYLAQNGITVITFDYCGIGKSLNRPIRELNISAADWGQNDLEAVISYAMQRYPAAGLTILGHSLGGQIIGLAKSSLRADQLILISAQSGYWKHWSGFDKIKMWGVWHLLFPPLTTMFGYMPSKKFSGMENLPRKVARQWRRWCTSENYLFDEIPEDKRCHHRISANLISVSIEDDRLAPKSAVDWLTGRYSSAAIERYHIEPHDYNVKRIGHFGIFRTRFKRDLLKLLSDDKKEI